MNALIIVRIRWHLLNPRLDADIFFTRISLKNGINTNNIIVTKQNLVERDICVD